jgi:Fe-S cluster assembly ATP-binding protein
MRESLTINNLHSSTVDGKEILHGITLKINRGETHAIMGPNGGGKTTLANVLMGHPDYKITQGTISLNGKNITNLPPDRRARYGLFLGFQYPVEIAGVNFASFLRMAINERLGQRSEERRANGQVKKISPIAFRTELAAQARKLALIDDMAMRSLNEGFSGGEKKKSEILQLVSLKPEYAILDEPDSGLDVDALKYIAKAVKALDYPLGLLLITHYQRILHYIKPDYVHILVQGKIIQSGNAALAKKIEKKGYEKYIK